MNTNKKFKYVVIISDSANPIADGNAPMVANNFSLSGGLILICNEALFMCIRSQILKKKINYKDIEFQYNGKNYYPTDLAKFEDASIFEAFNFSISSSTAFTAVSIETPFTSFPSTATRPASKLPK